MKNSFVKFLAAVLAIIVVIGVFPVIAEEDEIHEGEEIIIEVDYNEQVFKYNSYVYVHRDCGGTVQNKGNIFRNCYCDQCFEEHYWYSDFEFEIKIVPVYGPA